MSDNSSNPSPAVDAAKYISNRDEKDNIIVLPGGDKIKVIPVSATLIDEVVSRVEDPEVPMWRNPDKDRDEPNPNDPQYLREVAASERKRGIAAMDAMVMFGIELIDGVPPTDKWLKKLKIMEKMGHVDLSAYDMEDPIDVEFLYKRFILSDANLLNIIGRASGVASEDVQRAEKSFPSN